MSASVTPHLFNTRPMREEDLPSVLEIERKVYGYPWTEGIFRDCLRVGYCCWLHEEDGQVTAYGIMSVAVGEAHILNVCVDPARQRRGLGRHMMKHLLSLAVRHGADTALLEVRPSNRAALGLYESMGFNQVGWRRNYYPAADGREDALILALSLV
jgi:ribosomal-protein-alanine N-acetyltransferase